jgi:hypothetical protein
MDRMTILGGLLFTLGCLVVAGGSYWLWKQVNVWYCPQCSSPDTDIVAESNEGDVMNCRSCGHQWQSK